MKRKTTTTTTTTTAAVDTPASTPRKTRTEAQRQSIVKLEQESAIDDLKRRRAPRFTEEQSHINATRDLVDKLVKTDSTMLAYVAGQVSCDGYGGAAFVLVHHTHSGRSEESRVPLGAKCHIRQAHLLAIYSMLVYVAAEDAKFTTDADVKDMRFVDLAIVTTSQYAMKMLAKECEWKKSRNRELIAKVREAWCACERRRTIHMHLIDAKSSLSMTRARILAAGSTTMIESSKLKKEALFAVRQTDGDATDSEVEESEKR